MREGSKGVAENKLGQDADATPGENHGASKEAEAAVTPEMIEAGKLAINKSDDKTHSLENSIGEVYVAMAAQDKDALREKENTIQIEQAKRVNFRLYLGVIAIIILACTLITKIIFSILS
jgi:hypothetical protein